MGLDTLGNAKHLEYAGVGRQHAEAINRDLRPNMATQANFAGMEQRIIAAFENRLHQVEIRILGVAAAMLGLLFALLKLTPS